MNPILLSVLNPGGYNTLGLTAYLFEASKRQQAGLVEGRIYPLLFKDSTQAVDPICTEWDCFVEENTLWTQLNPSSISKVVDGFTYYLIRGYQDLEDYFWVVNFGVICSDTGEVTWVYSGVPVLKNGYFTSPGTLPEGIKVVQIVRLNSLELQPVQTLYGSFDQPPIPLTTFRANRAYTPEDQSLNLEDLALQIISQLTRSEWPSEPPDRVHSAQIDPLWIQGCQNAVRRIATLIDRNTLSPRLGSIPLTLTSYLTYEQIYDDEIYSQFKAVVEPECIEEGCVGQPINLSTSREVSNRALGWFLIALCLYHQILEPIPELINQIADYLADQTVSGRVRLGWTSTSTYLNSQAIDVYSTSTAAITSIALLKAYEITNQNGYLEKALSIDRWLFQHQYHQLTAHFAHSLSESDPSIESTLYGLMAAIFFNRMDIAQTQMERLEGFVRVDLVNFGELKLVEGSDHLTALTYHILTRVEHDLDLSAQEVLQTWRENLNPDSLDLIGTIFQDKNPTFHYLETNTQYIWSSPYLKNYVMGDIEQARFYQDYVLMLLKRAWPVDYSWPSLEAVEQGTLGKVLKSLSILLAPLFSLPYRFLRSTYLKETSPFYVDRWAADFKQVRRPFESIPQFQQRIQSFLQRKRFTSESLKTLPALFPGLVYLKERWEAVLTFNKGAYYDKPLLDEAYYEGFIYRPFSVEVEVPGPIDSTLEIEIERRRPVSCQLIPVGKLSFSAQAKSLQSVGTPLEVIA